VRATIGLRGATTEREGPDIFFFQACVPIVFLSSRVIPRRRPDATD
jgi:hypothetical protein